MTLQNLTKDRMKNALIEHLRQNPDTQFVGTKRAIEQSSSKTLNAQETRLLIELIHEFTVSNLLMPGTSEGASGWPWFSLTTHGREVLNKSGPPVYDYDGYLSELRGRVVDLDDVVERYLSESLRAYQANLYFAAMVMLGCASERAVNLLIEAYVDSIEGDTNREKLRSRISGRNISVTYDKFKQSFDSTRRQVKEEILVRDFDGHVDGVFVFVRLLRNSIVHPTATPNITNALVYSNLQQFSYYITTLSKLTEYYRKHKTIV